MSGRAADAGHLRMSSSHPVNFTLSPQGSACAGIKPGSSRTRVLCADAFNEQAWPRSGDGDADRRQKDAASSSISSEQQRLRRTRPRQEGSSRKNKWKHARLQGAQRREGVCVGLGCRGPGATLWTSFDVHLAISAPLGMGRRPKHIYTLTLRCTSRGHLELSLGFL